VHVAAAALLDDRALDSMVAHRSMRIDGPAFRGRPLGHRLDPLRCTLAELDPEAFDSVVDDLLKAHLFTDITELNGTRLIADGDGQRVRLLTGTLYTTYEYPFAGSVEIGFGLDATPREEGQFFSALGRVAVVVHSKVALPVQASSDAPALLAELEAAGFERVLVFANVSDYDLLFPYRSLLGQRCPVPQGLGSIAYNVLVATLVYLDHQENLRWDLVNYQFG
jgi:hypothetical protein